MVYSAVWTNTKTHLDGGLEEVNRLPLLVLLDQTENLPARQHVRRPPNQRAAHLTEQ